MTNSISVETLSEDDETENEIQIFSRPIFDGQIFNLSRIVAEHRRDFHEKSQTTKKTFDEDKQLQDEIQRIYGFDETSNENNGKNPHPSITVREYHPKVDRTEIRTEPNPNVVTYKQNITVRYLVPPTPPAPGPLIIRETIPPTTPSPIILREVPPTPPTPQQTTIINKIVEQEKPQSIIIEKWLPYKPAPPREIIYERLVDEDPILTQFQPQKSSLFDQIAQSTQKQIEDLEKRTREQIEGQQRWVENRIEQQENRVFLPMFPILTTPGLIVNHPPIIRSANLNFSSDAFVVDPSFFYSFYT